MDATVSFLRPSDHEIVRAIWGPLLADVLMDMRLAAAVGLCANAGLSPGETARRTGATPKQMRASWERLERVGVTRPASSAAG